SRRRSKESNTPKPIRSSRFGSLESTRATQTRSCWRAHSRVTCSATSATCQTLLPLKSTRRWKTSQQEIQKPKARTRSSFTIRRRWNSSQRKVLSRNFIHVERGGFLRQIVRIDRREEATSTSVV